MLLAAEAVVEVWLCLCEKLSAGQVLHPNYPSITCRNQDSAGSTRKQQDSPRLSSGGGSIMAAGGSSVPPQLGDVEEDASQLLFPKGDKAQHNTEDPLLDGVWLPRGRTSNVCLGEQQNHCGQSGSGSDLITQTALFRHHMATGCAS